MPHDAEFRTARSFDSALDRLAEATLAMGFDAVDYGQIPRAKAADGSYNMPSIEARYFPAHWQRGWTRYARIDPFLFACYPRTLPMDWRDVRGANWLSAKQRDAVAYVEDMGFVDGLSVPIHLPAGGFAFVSALSREENGAWRRHTPECRERLFLMAHDFHAAVGHRFQLEGACVSRAPQSLWRLSPREREVLALAADGHSAPQTAALLKRSVETVRRQRKSAMARLASRSMPQAVARAISLGLLSVSREAAVA